MRSEMKEKIIDMLIRLISIVITIPILIIGFGVVISSWLGKSKYEGIAIVILWLGTNVFGCGGN